MEEQLIIILALDNLVRTYHQQLTDGGAEFETEEDKMAFHEILDGAYHLLKRKVDQLPPKERSEITPNLWTSQISETIS